MNDSTLYGILPAAIMYHKTISANAKIIYAQIAALCNKTGYCWASNQYLGTLFDTDRTTVSHWIGELKVAGFVTVENNPGSDTQRRIFLTPSGMLPMAVEQLAPPCASRNPPCASRNPPLRQPQPSIVNNTKEDKPASPVGVTHKKESKESELFHKESGAPEQTTLFPIPSSTPRSGKSSFETQDLPFKSDAFTAIWLTWRKYLKEKSVKLAVYTRTAQLARLKTLGEAAAIAALEHTMSSGWNSLQEPRADKFGRSEAPAQTDITKTPAWLADWSLFRKTYEGGCYASEPADFRYAKPYPRQCFVQWRKARKNSQS